jgi:hypothetical protein
MWIHLGPLLPTRLCLGRQEGNRGEGIKEEREEERGREERRKGRQARREGYLLGEILGDQEGSTELPKNCGRDPS